MNDLFSQVETPLSVSELTRAIRENLTRDFGSIWVTGELSGVKKHFSGHCYFTLKDKGAALQGILFRSTLARLKFEPVDGMAVIARGKITVYDPQGKYQLETESLEPKGIGAREIAMRQLRERLLARGYFDPARKRKLPAFVRRLVLVTSPTGAAIRDMLQVLSTRWPVGEVVICPVRVQGDGAAQEIAAAIRLLNRLHASRVLAADAMIVGRGGGSVEDLWAFNEEIVVEAIFQSHIPVVSAVGHEIDICLCDHVADLHALTPTDAAVKVVPDRADLVQGLGQVHQRMRDALGRRLESLRLAVDGIRGRAPFTRPLARHQERRQRLDELATRLKRAVRQKLGRCADQASALAGQLDNLSPLNVLRRGYSLTRTEDSDEMVRSASALRPGDRLITRLAEGSVVSRVEEIRE